MIERLRDESGVAVAMAIAVLAIMMAMGLAIVGFSDAQQHAAGAERTTESGFNQAEGVLNAQIYQLANAWPATAVTAATAACTPTTAGATCPDATGLSATFANVDEAANPPATCTAPAIAPNPPAQAPLWRTVVQDDDVASGDTKYYDPTVMNPWTSTPRPSYDANGNNSVWVRATVWGQSCRPQTVVALATRALKKIDWPTSAISADWFKTTNNGNKVIVNTADSNTGAGTSPPPANVALRCQGTSHLSSGSCMVFKAGQVAPTVPMSQGNATPIIDANQLDSLRQQSSLAGMYNGTTCALPANWSTQTAGTVIYVKGGPTCTITGLSGNTAPLIFVLEDGFISLGGNAKFYGLVYDHNASNLTGSTASNSDPAVVTLGGCAHIQGLIAVDGFGGVNVGSCKQNVVYDSSVLQNLWSYGGAAISKGSFRTLPGA